MRLISHAGRNFGVSRTASDSQKANTRHPLSENQGRLCPADIVVYGGVRIGTDATHANQEGGVMMRGVTFAGWVVLLASLGLVALHLFPRLQLLGKTVLIAASLIPYGLPLAAVALLVLALSGSRPLSLGLVCVVLLAHVVIARPYWLGPSPAVASDPITVMTMNMRCDSRGTAELERLMLESNPDVAVVNGLSRKSREELFDALADRFPTAEFTPMRTLPHCGTVVFSRLPVDGGDSTRAHPTAFVKAPAFEFALVAVDLPTPTEAIGPWLGAFDEMIADTLALEGGHVVAVGDFNAVLEHEPMRRLMAETGLRDAVTASGLGWLPTFPDDGKLPALVALDHALISPGLAATAAWTESVPGQGHRALFVRVGVAE